MWPTQSSLLFSRSAQPLLDVPIRAWDGDHCSHGAIRVENFVIDATFFHGVAVQEYNEWKKGRVVVDDVPVYPSSDESLKLANAKLFAREGQKYDILETLGFPLLRDLGSPEKPNCSRLQIDYLRDACSLIVPGKQGRIGPRLVRIAIHAYNLGLLSTTGSPMANIQPS